MKKSIVLLLALILSITLLAGCDGIKNEPIPPPTAATEMKTDSPSATHTPSATKTFLTIDEARAILQGWIDNHPFQLSSSLEPESDDHVIAGVGYYRFYLGIERFGVAEILIHKVTGELFHLASPDNTTFEPLDNWYDENHSPELHSVTLTEVKAREIAQAWLDSHPIQDPNVLELEYDNAIADDEEYYAFYLDSHEMYWFSILVRKETGELFCRVKSDGEFPTEDIEPLDDWYIRFFS